MKHLFFEELEKMEELDAVSDFFGAAAPFVAIGLGVAIVIVKLNDKSKSSNT